MSRKILPHLSCFHCYLPSRPLRDGGRVKKELNIRLCNQYFCQRSRREPAVKNRRKQLSQENRINDKKQRNNIEKDETYIRTCENKTTYEKSLYVDYLRRVTNTRVLRRNQFVVTYEAIFRKFSQVESGIKKCPTE